ncbi:tyrosine-type recombinase/integrase [Coprobacillus cateniformis]|uniref:tyrosine-type recombinase/integrase n=1 Tax=Coprobacillus cateniformis TaxID=100884 RepID=UPI000E5204BF|nr:tyrosine-type recombinase/integrase [Coprobacillus cateniformis]RGY45254.1 recombinase XerC [Coprobacillus cateniformis]
MKYKHVENYLNYCQYQKRLTGKTLKAYRIDLNQFYTYMQFKNLKNKKDISVYIQQLHTTYKPRTVKRKIAAIKAFYTYLEKPDFLKENPFHKIDYRFKEPIRLPKTITLHELNHLYQSLYAYSKQTSNRVITRDIAILELLICTGIRVSEVSHLLKSNVFIRENTIIINGKGSKERIIYIDNQNLIQSLLSYQRLFQDEIEKSPYFFINRLGHHLSEQSIRFMIVKYCHLFHIDSHITPHMFRHTFATMMLEEDVDIRYIQEILGHSSITTTQIYTHMSAHKQKEIMSHKNPRNKIHHYFS